MSSIFVSCQRTFLAISELAKETVRTYVQEGKLELPKDISIDHFPFWLIMNPDYASHCEKTTVDVVNPPFNAMSYDKSLAKGDCILDSFPLWNVRKWRCAVYGKNAEVFTGHPNVAVGIAKIFWSKTETPTRFNNFYRDLVSEVCSGGMVPPAAIESKLDAAEQIIADLKIHDEELVGSEKPTEMLAKIQQAINESMGKVKAGTFSGKTADDWKQAIRSAIGVSEEEFSDTSHDGMMNIIGLPEPIRQIIREAIKRSNSDLPDEVKGHYRDVYRSIEWIEKLMTKCFGPMGCATDYVTLCAIASGASIEEACDPGTDRKESPKYFKVLQDAIVNRDQPDNRKRMAEYALVAMDWENDDMAASSEIAKARSEFGMKRPKIIGQSTTGIVGELERHGYPANQVTQVGNIDLYVLPDPASRNEEAALPSLQQVPVKNWFQ